jgi:hypothetical protein
MAVMMCEISRKVLFFKYLVKQSLNLYVMKKKSVFLLWLGIYEQAIKASYD